MEYIEFVVPIENALTTDPVQAMFCGPVALMQQALRALESGGLPITVLRTEYPGRDLSIVDVLNVDCSKGHALERWANHRGISREQVMAIGDNYNDVEMLAFAGHPFIMENASEELRGRGWTETRSNAEGGVAAAVECMLRENAPCRSSRPRSSRPRQVRTRHSLSCSECPAAPNVRE